MNNGKYDDIINLPHHVSNKHPRMSLEDRSAQFAPFSALTGYADAIKETERVTDRRKDIDENLQSVLDNKLHLIKESINTRPKITFTYFVPDLKKYGGEYVTVTGIVRKIDNYDQVIILEDMTKIPIFEVIDISGEIFELYC